MCECATNYICKEHSKAFFDQKEAVNNEDLTVYKFTMNIKSDVPYSSNYHGAYTIYEGSTVTRITTHKVLDKEIKEFNAKGGKVISIHCEIATKTCPKCNSEVVYAFYDFNHNLCNDCVDSNSTVMTENVNNIIESIKLAKFLNYSPKFNRK